MTNKRKMRRYRAILEKLDALPLSETETDKLRGKDIPDDMLDRQTLRLTALYENATQGNAEANKLIREIILGHGKAAERLARIVNVFGGNTA